MSEEQNGPLFLHTSGPLPMGINHHWKPRIRRRSDGRKYIQIDLSDVGMSYRSQMQEAIRAYLDTHRATQSRLDYAYCNGDGLGVVANLYFPNHRADLDGPLKLALDALVDGLDLDDDQIGLVTAFKAIDAADPRLELWVGTLEDAAKLAINRLQQIATTPDPSSLSQEGRESSLNSNPKPQTSPPTHNSQFTIHNSQFSIVLPDPPSFNKAWQWRIERTDSGRVRPVAYLSPAYTRYKQAAKERTLHILQGKGEAAGELAKSLATASSSKSSSGLGIVITLSQRDGDTDNYVKPTIDAVIEALNAAAPSNTDYAPLNILNDRYITMLVAVKNRASSSSSSASITLAPLSAAASEATTALHHALSLAF